MDIKWLMWLSGICVVICGILMGISLFFKMYILLTFWLILMLHFSNSAAEWYEIRNEEEGVVDENKQYGPRT